MQSSGKQLTKIVITGGPCAGKTSVLRILKEKFRNKGYTVVTVAETATELICSGIAPWTMDNKVNYQLHQLMLQLEKERIYAQACTHLSTDDKIILMFDRGGMDNKAYLFDEEFDYILERLSLTTEDILKRYDAVFHLESCANGRDGMYTVQNNVARTESRDEAKQLDDRIAVVWKDHPYFGSVSCAPTIEEKANVLFGKILSFLDKGTLDDK